MKLEKMPPFFHIAVQDFGIRVDNYQSRGPVDNHVVVGPDHPRDVFKPHHRRNFNGLRDDRRMGGPPSHIGGKAQNLVDHHLGGIRR